MGSEMCIRDRGRIWNKCRDWVRGKRASVTRKQREGQRMKLYQMKLLLALALGVGKASGLGCFGGLRTPAAPSAIGATLRLIFRRRRAAGNTAWREASAPAAAGPALPQPASARASQRACLLTDTTSAWAASTDVICGPVVFDNGDTLCILIEEDGEPDRWVCS